MTNLSLNQIEQVMGGSGAGELREQVMFEVRCMQKPSYSNSLMMCGRKCMYGSCFFFFEN